MCVTLSDCPILGQWQLKFCVSLKAHLFPCHLNWLKPGSAPQLQGCTLQQWCPHTTHYLEGFSLSRCYSGRNGVKLRCKEKLVWIGSLALAAAIHDFLTGLQQQSTGGCSIEGRHCVPRVDIYLFPLVTSTTRKQKDIEFHREKQWYGKMCKWKCTFCPLFWNSCVTSMNTCCLYCFYLLVSKSAISVWVTIQFCTNLMIQSYLLHKKIKM